jgi:hypothetical protein
MVSGGARQVVAHTDLVRARVRIRKYHPRQWVDCSGTAYTGAHLGFPVFLFFLASRREGRKGTKQKEERGSLRRLSLDCAYTESRPAPFVLLAVSLAARRKEQTKNENPDTLLL